MKRISVCIATHNGEKYLKKQLDSILSQLSIDDEIIISDDGSIDNTLSIAESYSDNRIKIINFRQPKNNLNGSQRNLLFASRNFENALKYASGNFIFLCDQDDIWYPNKVERVMEALTKNDIVKHNFSIIDKVGTLKEEAHYISKVQTNRSWIHLIRTLPFRGCCMAFHRWILDAAQPFPKECLQHDSWIGLIAKYKKAKYFYITQPLIYHRLHSNNTSELSIPNSLLFKLLYRLKLLYQLFSLQS